MFALQNVSGSGFPTLIKTSSLIKVNKRLVLMDVCGKSGKTNLHHKEIYMRCPFHSKTEVVLKNSSVFLVKEFVYVSNLFSLVNKAKRLQLQFVRINMASDILTTTLKIGIQPKQPTLDI